MKPRRSAGAVAIGNARAAKPGIVLAEDFSLLVYGPRRIRWVRSTIVLLH